MFFLIYSSFISEQKAWQLVYSNKLFELTMFLLFINLLGIIVRFKIYKKLSIFIFHLSILFILLGAGITRYFSIQGIIDLKENQITNKMLLIDKSSNIKKFINLGFDIKLNKFVIHKYPGSNEASSYDSYITIFDKNKTFKFHIYMNHPIVYKGFKIYQMGFDKNESILFLNKDKGVYVTYLGYILLIIGFILLIFDKRSVFYKTILALKRSGVFVILFIFHTNLFSMNLDMFNKNSKLLENDFKRILVQFNGRVMPLDTFNLLLVKKISKTDKVSNLDYNQIIMGLIAFPNEFVSFPLIYVKSKFIRKKLGIKKYATYNDFIDKNGNFLYQKEVNDALKTPPKNRNAIQREWVRLNENIYILYSIFSLRIFNIFATQDSKKLNNKWFNIYEIKGDIFTKNFYNNLLNSLIFTLQSFNVNKLKDIHNIIYDLQRKYTPTIIPSKFKVEAEIFYNYLDLFKKLIYIYLLLAIITIIMAFIKIFKNIEFNLTILFFIIFMVFLAHTFNMILRWYISAHAPWSNAYESIIFIAWSSVFVALIFRKNLLALGSGLIISAIFMLIAHLNSINPQITNVVPVLKSYWLLIHVAIITISYGFLAIASLLGFFNLILFTKKGIIQKTKDLNNIIFLALYIGLVFLTIGTFLGGVWANETWGSYWSWDIKETWSLITIIAYALLLHFRFFIKNEFIFSLLVFLAFFFVLMTYFGVNFYMAKGLHSYGRAEGSIIWFDIIKVGIFAYISIFIIAVIIAIKDKNVFSN